MATAEPAVRFSDKNQEFEPSLQQSETHHDESERAEVPPEVQRDLRDLSISMQKSRLQSRRMENYAFEPVSLPASRVPSPSPQAGSHAGSGRGTPAASSPVIAAQSPPLTPAASGSKEGLKKGHGSTPNLAKKYPEPPTITPQMSPPLHDKDKQSSSQSTLVGSRPPSSGRALGESGIGKEVSRSAPGSRTSSPVRKGSGAASPRTANFRLEEQNPYARNRRLPQAPGAEYYDPRYRPDPKRHNSGTPAAASAADTSRHRPREGSAQSAQSNRKSGIFGGLYHIHPDEDKEKHGGSMHDLKRFFKFGHKHKHSTADTKAKKASVSGSSGTRTPPHHRDSTAPVPFSDDHGLENKYGKFGKVLGSGAGGSVRLIKRASDGTTFAVKQFRARHTYESEKEYNKKVTAEFCVGSTLHHGNIIETLDIIQEKGNWYEVMEYAPYDLFACVMTGKMSREEVICTFMQITSGVKYLHEMGLAHRDLKLDNVVVNDKGIMKLIDFGSAIVFKYPFEDEVVKASGIVGSDPYLAPEVYDESKYAPEAVDVWSLAIIYCCMALRRFPWKLPRTSDVSYRYFVADPTPGTPSVESLRRRPSESDDASMSHGHHHDQNTTSDSASVDRKGSTASDMPQQSLRGPWRLLRLLPRESRFCIGRMLDTDPKARATLDEVYSEPWLQRDCCSQDETGQVHRAPGHEHTLEPGSSSGDSKK